MCIRDSRRAQHRRDPGRNGDHRPGDHRHHRRGGSGDRHLRGSGGHAPAGDLEVVVTVPSTGTTTSFAIPVAEVAGPACTVDYRAIRLWPRSMLGAVTVTNTGTDPVPDWELAWQ